MGPGATTPLAEVQAAIDVLETTFAVCRDDWFDSTLDHLRRARTLLRGEESGLGVREFCSSYGDEDIPASALVTLSDGHRCDGPDGECMGHWYCEECAELINGRGGEIVHRLAPDKSSEKETT